ncbi:hypothetical protein [Rhizobium sp. LjRoot258]|uniref:hypothetical protein n=1 Tax=Rhizobium sp. LjRoot258 TaxID=3342299 RepID=UPI003ECE05CE
MQSSRASRDGTANPTVNEIRDQIERILSSGEFHAPDRGRRFLEFIVEETLSGRADYLKAYTIAQEVFARDTSFDAQNDPVVRIEAGRIRRALERYYLVAGHADSIVVTIPKGGYVPSFGYAEGACEPTAQVVSAPSTPLERDPTEPAPAPVRSPPTRYRRWIWYATAVSTAIVGVIGFLHAPRLSLTAPPPLSSSAVSSDGTQPRIMVEPFQNVPGKAASADIAQGLTDEVVGQLTKFREIVVIAPRTQQGSQAEEPWFALQGSVRLEADKMRLIARLIRRADGAVIWADDYDADLRERNLLEVETDVAQRIATTIAQPYGIAFQPYVSKVGKPDSGDWEAYSCALSYYAYRAELDPRMHTAVRDCLKQAIRRLPTNSTYWALLSLIYLDEVRFQYQLRAQSSPRPLELAADAAKRAVDLDPQNARALQALMLASFFSNDVDAALRAGAAAYAINPNDTEVAGEYGFRLAMSGKWDTGCELISGAISRNPGPRGYYEVGMALCAYMRGDNQAAELWARMADLKYNPMHHLVLLAILGASGKLDEARSEQDWLRMNAPVLMEDIRKEVALRLHRPQDQEHFLDGLRASGVAIPPGDGMIGSQ